jgi:hypothetical protein
LFPDTLQNIYPNNCQGLTTLTNLRGSVEDGSGWFGYLNNSSCTWLIAPQDIEYDSVKNIKLTFLKLDIEVNGDTLYLYDGPDDSYPLLRAYTGNSIPASVTSVGNKVFVKFITNTSITKQGWQFDYESIFPVYCSGITTITSPSGSISDGSGEKKYSNNVNCRWKITPSGNMPVTFYFTSFETFDSTDIVKIYDLDSQEVLGEFSGNQLPPAVTANSGRMLIIFMTNSAGNAQGWSGEFFTSGVGLPETDSCLFETLIYPNPSNGQITIEKNIASDSEHDLTICVIDTKGKTVYDKNFKVFSGFNTFSVNLKDAAEGVYFLIIKSSLDKEVRKIVIEK